MIAIIVGSIIGVLFVFYYQSVGFDLSFFYGDGTGFQGYTFNLIIHPVFVFSSYLKLVAVASVFMICAGLYPAIQASSKNPVEVMK